MHHLYIHVPFCDGKCLYCGFFSELYFHEAADKYLDCLAVEMDLYLAGKPVPSPITIYIGGGTPTVLSAKQLDRLINIVRSRVDISALREWTIESNPGTLSGEKAACLAEHSVNRLSIGAQSFCDSTLQQMLRRHKASDISDCFTTARSAGFDNIGLDLIAGFPDVSDDEWRNSIRSIIDLNPKHISVYALSSEENSGLARLHAEGKISIPDDDAQIRAIDIAQTMLTPAGFGQYETSNYAQPGFECLHNLSCWRGLDYIGFGPSASSRAGLKRWTNINSVNGYIEALSSGVNLERSEETLSEADDITERLMFNFRLAEGVDLQRFILMLAQTPTDSGTDQLAKHWESALNRMGSEGLVLARDGRWFLTERGKSFADYVASELIL